MKNVLVALLLTIIALLMIEIFTNKKNIPIIIQKCEQKSVDTTFSAYNLKEYILTLNIKYPDVVFAQAIIESGHFKSNLFRTNNNLFGMTIATKRPTTAIKTKNYARYNNWRESVIDYAFYQQSFIKNMNKEKYINYISRNYSKSKHYKELLLSVMKSNKYVYG